VVILSFYTLTVTLHSWRAAAPPQKLPPQVRAFAPPQARHGAAVTPA